MILLPRRIRLWIHRVPLAAYGALLSAAAFLISGLFMHSVNGFDDTFEPAISSITLPLGAQLVLDGLAYFASVPFTLTIAMLVLLPGSVFFRARYNKPRQATGHIITALAILVPALSRVLQLFYHRAIYYVTSPHVTHGSFPDARVASAIAFYGFAAASTYRSKRGPLRVIGAIALAVIVSAAAACQALHYSDAWPTDVGGGIFLGLSFLFIAYLVVTARVKPGGRSEWSPRKIANMIRNEFRALSGTAVDNSDRTD